MKSPTLIQPTWVDSGAPIAVWQPRRSIILARIAGWLLLAAAEGLWIVFLAIPRRFLGTEEYIFLMTLFCAIVAVRPLKMERIEIGENGVTVASRRGKRSIRWDEVRRVWVKDLARPPHLHAALEGALPSFVVELNGYTRRERAEIVACLRRRIELAGSPRTRLPGP